jgi:hypothetical protein
MCTSKLIARNPSSMGFFFWVVAKWSARSKRTGLLPLGSSFGNHPRGKPSRVCSDQNMCTDTHTHTTSTCKYIKLEHFNTRKQCSMVPSHQHILFVTHSNIRPLLPFRAVHAICLHKCGSTAQIHELAEASHPHVSGPHSSTHAVAKQTAHHISSATYHISLARSTWVCFQQRCHHLWPGLLLCGTMQRQLVVLRRRRQRTTSARHTDRQAGTLVLPSILVATCEYVYAGKSPNMQVS